MRASARAVLGAPDYDGLPPAGRSALNNDGVPFQLCLTAKRAGWDLRLLGDPWSALPTEARYAASLGALPSLLESGGAAALRAAVETTIRLIFPDSPEARAAYRDGFLWFALSPGRPGAAIYAEAAPLGVAGGWQAAERWLAAVLPESSPALAAVRQLSRVAVLASVALEGATPEDARAKLYFRFARPAALDALEIPLFTEPAVMRVLELAIGDRTLDLDGLVMSAGFSLASGALTDVKLDLCGHCLAYETGEWLAVIEACRRELDLAPLPLDHALTALNCEIAFLGVGTDVRGECRLNVYLKDRGESGPPGRDEIAAALEDAVSYLLGVQRPDGAWTDYELPVGPSDEWVTAYVGWAMARMGRATGHEPALAGARRAARWLLNSRSYPAGWGYNGRVGPDADSTAMAIALLTALGFEVAEADRSFLRRHWRRGEGMATYRDGPGAWANAHWDVTPWGYLGLAAADRAELRSEFLAALRRNRTEDGLWRAYWWRTPLYSTFLTLEALRELGIPAPETGRPTGPFSVDNPFDLANAIGISALAHGSAEAIGRPLRTLLDWQLPDGRWPGSANLRVTDDGCSEPWVKPEGAYYADAAGTLTTATAVRALTHLLQDVFAVRSAGEAPASTVRQSR